MMALSEGRRSASRRQDLSLESNFEKKLSDQIDHQEDLQDLQENNSFSLTTKNGDIFWIYYERLRRRWFWQGSVD